MSRGAWWQDGVVYQVYVRSFADANGDGIGDLPGITSRLPYLTELGVDAVWLTPFYLSPMADHGYDVADQCDVDPLFGTLADADELLRQAHALGLRVIVDLVPNHSSSRHKWFQEALADPASAYRDRYLFRRAGPDGGPPNNWESVFGGPAWTLDEPSGEYYLHLFDSGQPDFDWRHPAVHVEWERILRFWLDRGVDGFRIDVAHGLYKQVDLSDNPPSGSQETTLFHAASMPHAWDQPEVVEVYRRWRQVLDEYDARVMVGEVFLSQLDKVARFVGADRLHQSFNFPLLVAPFEADAWRALITEALAAFAVEGASPTWVLSNHDVIRHPTRYGGGVAGGERARAATLTLLALPGAPYLYEGEELGLEQDEVPPDYRQDPIWQRSKGAVTGRDGSRTPMPWTADPPGYGFTAGAPWLPFGPQAAERNVATETADASSTLAFYRRALRLRRELTPDLGATVRWLDLPSDLLGFARTLAGRGELVCVLNATDRARDLAVVASSPLVTSGAGVFVGPEHTRIPARTAAWLLADV
ncbi:MAG: alpha amylase catalytic region [Frankiales bacterium]|nr:alpha amylase catalytic region [Frankiales bacterium]